MYSVICVIVMSSIQLNLVDSKSSGPRKILRNTEASDKRITNIHVYLPKNISVAKIMLKPKIFLVIKNTLNGYVIPM